MAVTYQIKFTVSEDFDPTALFAQLPSPIDRTGKGEIYNYRIEADGFYLIDYQVSRKVAAVALRLFIDAALAHAPRIEIVGP